MHVGIDASRIALEERTGTENYTYNLIEAIKKVDKVNKYTLYFNKLPQYFEISQSNVSTRYIPMLRFWTQFRLLTEVMLNPPDILFIPAHTLPLIRRASLKTVVTVHDLGSEFLPEYHQFPQKLYLNWSTKFAVAQADSLIAVSESTKRDLVKKLGAKPGKISVIHEGIDKSFYFKRDQEEINRVRSHFGLTRPYLLFVGTVQPRKNLEFLISAFAEAKIKGFDLVIAGKPGWLYEEIYKAPAKFAVEKHVKFLGFVDSQYLPGLYSGAGAFVYPSLYEGFGLPLLEALACGCPIIEANNSSIPEVVGEAGLLFKTNDKKDFIKQLRRVLKDDLLLASLEVKAEEQLKKFNWDKTAKETVELFEKVYYDKKK
jgi:glycosyltransferase involved in cell wall biosynthesis